ncbi:MAG: Holliday junction resolvase-like protein [Blastocatellia bacterium]|nr:Holliday junction resolvase-like protein [Blastocatellia bacterium]
MDFSHLFLVVLLIIAGIVIAILAYRFAALQSQLPLLVSEECEQWKRGAESDLQNRLRLRFQEWRDKEAQTVHARARQEALTLAHELFKQWCENEMEALRRDQREMAHREATNQLIEWKQAQEKLIRDDAVQRSQSVTLGKITEHLVPHLPNFNYNPKDARFIGSPIDFVVFDGLSDEQEGQIREIVFIEIKTGAATLSRRERLVRDAVRAGRVKWIEWHASRELARGAPSQFE